MQNHILSDFLVNFSYLFSFSFIMKIGVIMTMHASGGGGVTLTSTAT